MNASESITGKTILLVEDEPMVRAFMAQMLPIHVPKSIVLEAGTLADGLALAKMARLVLLDLCLPDATGIQAVTIFTEQFPDLPIVVMSGAGKDLLEEALAAGADEYVEKGNFTGVELAAKIRSAFARRAAWSRVKKSYQDVRDKLDSLKG